MKKFTMLLMGSAAAVSIMAVGTQAADPPLDEPAVAVCDAFGAGFWAVPGTNNCIRISGEIRADYTYHTKTKDRASISGLGATDRIAPANAPGVATATDNDAFGLGGAIVLADNERTRVGVATPAANDVNTLRVLTRNVGTITHPANFTAAADASVLALTTSNLDDERADLVWGSRFRFNLDVQSMTEWGVLRAFGRFQGTGGGDAIVDKAYVQFAGLTAGWNTSNFAFDDVDDTVNGKAFDGAWDTHMLAYTFAAGNGITATLAIEDQSISSRDGEVTFSMGSIATPGATGAIAANNFRNSIRGGEIRDKNMPDVVAAFQIEQAWGRAKLAGIYHRAEARLDAMSATGGGAPAVPVGPWKAYSGYAITAGAAINVPVMSGGVFNIAGSWGSGFGNGIGMGAVAGSGMPDVTIDNAGNVHKTKGWSLSAGLDMPFTDQLMLNVAGGYLDADNDINDALYADLGVRAYAIAASVKWSPVPDFGISLGAAYDHAKYTAGRAPVEEGTTGVAATGEHVYATNFERKVTDISVRLRVERDF